MPVKHWHGKSPELQQVSAQIDWSAAWLAPLRALGEPIAAAADYRAALNQAAQQLQVRNHLGHPLCFVAQEELPEGESYEAYISATGRVPTRANLHDFFNALVWLTFPRIKVQLNALQAAQIARLGVGKSRGSARDAATLFDENAALLAVTDNPAGQRLVKALRSHEWQQLFVTGRAQFLAQTQVFLFGHALMDKLVHPYKAITAHSLICWVPEEFHLWTQPVQLAWLDQYMAAQLASPEAELHPAAFSPLPVLGVPDWWPEQSLAFYADTQVFRPARIQK